MTNDNPFSLESRQQKLHSPTQIGKTLKVTALPSYLLACTALLLLGAFFVWGFLGTVSDKAYYSGVVFPSEGTTDLSLPNRGMVRTIFVHSGDHVSRGQTVALVSIDDSYSILTSTVEGTIINTKVDNEAFEAFEPIVSVVSGNGNPVQRSMLIAFIDNAGQRYLQEGMVAQVWPENGSPVCSLEMMALQIVHLTTVSYPPVSVQVGSSASSVTTVWPAAGISSV